MASYIEKTLLPNEKILHRGHRHWIVFWVPVFWLLVSGLVFIEFSGQAALALFIFVAVFLTLIKSSIDYFMTEMAVTNMRVIIKVGWIGRESLETMIFNVSSIEIDQSILGRMLNYGAVMIADRGSTLSPYQFIQDPLAFRRAVQSQIEKRAG